MMLWLPSLPGAHKGNAGHWGAFLCFCVNYRAKEWPVSLHTQEITAQIIIHQNAFQN